MRSSCRIVARALLATGVLAALCVSGDAFAAPVHASAALRGHAKVSGVSISTLNRDETTTATISGSGFAAGTKVSFGPSVAASVRSFTSTSLTVHLSATPDATVGQRTLTVTVPHKGTTTLHRALRVGYAPVFTKWAVGDGAVDWPTSLVRPMFSSLPLIGFSGTGVTVAHESLSSTGQLEVQFSITRSAHATWRTMTIVDGPAKWVIAHGLKVRSAPRVASVTPLGQGESGLTVAVVGRNFEVCKGANPSLSISGPGVTVNSVSSALGTVMYANLSVASNAPLGPRDVTISNCDSGGTATYAGAFRVLGPPQVATIPAIALGVTRTETVHGTNLTPGTSLSASGSGVTFSKVSYESPTKLRATVSVSPSATVGPYNVTATDVGGANTTSFQVLTIDPLPTESSLSPLGVGANTVILLFVRGTGFESGAKVLAQLAGHPDAAVRVGPARVDSAGELEVLVGGLSGLGLGDVTITVENPDGGTASTLTLVTDAGPAVTRVASSTTTTGAISVTFAAPTGAPAGEHYEVVACLNAGMTQSCAKRPSFASGSLVTGLVAADRYYVRVDAPSSGSYYAADSAIAGPVRATARLDAPSITVVSPSTKYAGAVAVVFSAPKNAPKGQHYDATACRNVQMTAGCVTAAVSSGGAVRGLVAGGTYHVVVDALASSGYLASKSAVSGNVRATIKLDAPAITSATLSSKTVVVDFTAPSNRPPGQRFTVVACSNASLSSNCVTSRSYRSGEKLTGFGASTCYVKVTATASPGYLATSSKVVKAS